jgi:glucose/mannose-6-phosphate isomerase
MGSILDAIRAIPRQAREGLQLGRRVRIRSDIQHVIFAGMGGSGIPGDLMQALMRESRTPVTVNKDYKLPAFAGQNTLAVVISYSGDTEETLAAYRDAITSRCTVLAITSGGKLAELCQSDKTPLIIVPGGLVPRQALGYFLFALLGCFTQSGLLAITDDTLEQAIMALENTELGRKAEELFQQFKGKVPLIYTSQALAGLGLRWKQALNENGKIPAYTGTFTELCHNEVEGSASPLMKGFHAVFIRDERDHPGVQKRMAAVKAILKEKSVTVTEIMLRGDHLLIKLCSAIQLGDYIAYFLARDAGIDPLDTPVIRQIKERVRKP